jgi:predicted Zn-dependent protease
LAIACVAVCVPAHAQFGGVGEGLRRVQQAKDAKQKFDDMNITDEEERTIGEDVSARIRQRFGVVQDPAVHKYVATLGTLLAQQSERPALAWSFVVLDTDGVNAFASPGGIVHITRGALGLVKNEAELAGVLGHEIGHVAHKHAIGAIKKNKAVQIGTSETLSGRGPFLDQLANRMYETILENSFDRGDELDADKVSVQLAQKLGYSAGGAGDFLARLDERNKDQPAKNGLFASHPETKERIDRVRQLAAASKAAATVEARYKANVKYEPTPLAKIATVEDGASGLAGSSAGKDDKKTADDKSKQEEPRRKGFGLGALTKSAGPEKQSTQVSASGGARGIGPDRAAKGGGNPNLVKVAVSAADVETFRKGIV